MKLGKFDIPYMFLSGNGMTDQIMKGIHGDEYTTAYDDDPAMREVITTTWRLLCTHQQKAYFITDTVKDKLSLLKVKKETKFLIRDQFSHETKGEWMTYDWRVFKTVNKKVSFIFSDESVLRIMFDDSGICIFYLEKNWTNLETMESNIRWVMCWVDREGFVSENWVGEKVQAIEEFVYKILCFVYLSDNEEVVVNPGARHGTRKSGKLVNTLPIPMTVVTSKWNITSIRTEGFDVSGHFRLQPTSTGTRMIWIDPFRKHGYTRKAKKLDE